MNAHSVNRPLRADRCEPRVHDGVWDTCGGGTENDVAGSHDNFTGAADR